MGLLHRDDPKIERLHHLKPFEHSSREAIAHLAAAADEVVAPAGTVIYEEGRRYHDVYVITEGEAHMSIHGEDFVEVDAGHVIGELAMFEHTPATGTVTATTQVRALAIPYNRFDEVLHEHPDLTVVVAKQLADRVVFADRELTNGHHSNGGPHYYH